MVTIDRPRTEGRVILTYVNIITHMYARSHIHTASEVVLAVQCEDGSRVQGKFNPTSTSLWGVISQLGVVTEDGVGRFEPVVVYMNNQVSKHMFIVEYFVHLTISIFFLILHSIA